MGQSSSIVQTILIGTVATYLLLNGLRQNKSKKRTHFGDQEIVEEAKVSYVKQLDYSDVLICPKNTDVISRQDAILEREFKFKNCPRKIKGIGIMTANMATTGTFEMAKVLQPERCFTVLHKHYSKDELVTFLTENQKTFSDNDLLFVTTGIKGSETTLEILRTGLCKNVCLDVANGYMVTITDFVKKLRSEFPHLLIMVGNVVTGGRTQELIKAGADIIKIGIGPGSACTTRKMTGVGRPQLSAVLECAEAATQAGGCVCADGGCVFSGDVAKAFASNAHFVMLGGMIAGADEAAGELIEKSILSDEIDAEGKQIIIKEKIKIYYGMSSKYAQQKHSGGMCDYRASEGRLVQIPYTGPVLTTIKEIMGGIRSAMTYVGCRHISEFHKNVQFYPVNRQLNNVFADKEIQ